jgi:hypothetical protein
MDLTTLYTILVSTIVVLFAAGLIGILQHK